MNRISTVKNSLMESIYPAGWDMTKMDECCEKGVAREAFWNEDFQPVACDDIHEFDAKMGHEIALQIKLPQGVRPVMDTSGKVSSLVWAVGWP